MPDVTLIIDNYDSFVYNIAQIVAELGSTPIVVRNDEIGVKTIARMKPDRIIISPGPGSPYNPRDVGVSRLVVEKLGKRIPILGVCLGHEVIAVAYGARVVRAKKVMHGKTCRVVHYGGPLYYGVPREFTAMRYHSLAVDPNTVPDLLIVDAVSAEDGEVMGLRHAEHPVYGVQYHPESIGTPLGKRILKNFLDLA